MIPITILRTDGRAETHHADRAEVFRIIERLIGADCLDAVNLRDGRVMFVDDNGHEDAKPDHPAATALYHGVCKPGTTHRIVGDVAIVRYGFRDRRGLLHRAVHWLYGRVFTCAPESWNGSAVLADRPDHPVPVDRSGRLVAGATDRSAAGVEVVASRQTEYNRRQSVERLQPRATIAGAVVTYDVHRGFVVARDGTILVAGRFEVVHAWLAGYESGRKP